MKLPWSLSPVVPGCCSVCLFMLFSSLTSLNAQVTVWLEDFSGANQGWTQNFTDCDVTPSGFAGVQNGRFEVNNMEGAPCCVPLGTGGGNNNEWTTNPIDIQDYCTVDISVTYGFVGSFECTPGGPYFDCQANLSINNGHDQMVFEYSIDGGPWIQFEYVCGGQAGVATITGLTGNDIRIRIRPANKASAETYWFDNVTVTGFEAPTVNAPADITVCSNSAVNVPITGSPGAAFSWTNSNPGIGLAAAGTGNINFTSANVGVTTTGTITITPSENGCDGPPETFTITVEPAPTVNNPGNQSVCGNELVNIAFTGNATSYTWTNSNPGIGLPASGAGDINFTSANVSVPTVGTITVTPATNGCNGTPQVFTITVNPAPFVTNPGNQNVCSNALVNVIFSGNAATYNWTNDNPGIGLPASGTGNISFTTTNGPATANITVIPLNGGCSGASQTFSITITAPPAVNPVSDVSVCAGDPVAVNFSGSASTYSWTNNNPGIGLPASGSGNINFTTANVGAQTVGTITVTPSENGCDGTPETFTITVNPAPTVDNPGNQSVCDNELVNVAFTGSGGTYNWTNDNPGIGLPASGSGNISFTAGAGPATANITVTPTANGCDGTPQTFTITVTPAPTVDNPGNQTVCGNAPVNVAFTGSGGSYNWTNDNPAIGLPASGSGNISFTAGAGPATANITVTPTASGCDGTPQTFTITVNSTPTVDNPGNQTVCDNEPVNVAFTGSGGTYNWTNDNPGIGLPASGSGNISFTAGAGPATANITVTPTANGCDGTPQTFTVTVNPAPTVDNPGNQTVCGNAPVNVAFTGSGGTYNWTNDNPAIGLPASGSGNISFTAGAGPATANITVTPTANGCDGTPQTFTITVNSTPTVDNPGNQTVCSNEPVNVAFTGSGGTYNWTNDNPAIGLPASGSGNISFTAGAGPATANITVTPTANGCDGTPQTFTITVEAIPAVDNPGNQTVCGNAPVNVVLTGSGGTYNWTNDNPAIGLPASGSGNINFTAGAGPATANITVTPTANGCDGTPQTFTITVNPAPTVDNPGNQTVCSNELVNVVFTGSGGTYNWTNDNPAIGLPASGSGNINFTAGAGPATANITVTPTANGCDGTPQTFAITIGAPPGVNPVQDVSACGGGTVTVVFSGLPGTQFNWTNDNPGIGLPASGSGQIIFTAANPSTTQVATIEVTPQIGGCTGNPQQFTITITPAPTANLSPTSLSVCGGQLVEIDLSANATPGATVTWTNNNTATGIPAFGAGDISQIASTVSAQEVSQITVIPTLNGCTGVPEIFTLTVLPEPVLDNLSDTVFCAGDSVRLSFSGTNGANFSWINNNPNIGLDTSGTGDIVFVGINGGAPDTAQIIVTPELGLCEGTPDTFSIVIISSPSLDTLADLEFCGLAQVDVAFSGTPGAVFNWANSNPAIGLTTTGTGDLNFTAADVSAVTNAQIVAQATLGSCASPADTFEISITPTYSVAPQMDVAACAGQDIDVVFVSTGGNPLVSWTSSNPAIGLPASGTGNISFAAPALPSDETSQIIVTPFQGVPGCYGPNDTFNINIVTAPAVTNPGVQSFCAGDSVNIALSGTPSAQMVWTNSNPAIGLPASGSGTLVFTAAAVAAPATGTITVTPEIGACIGASESFEITVNPQPVASITGAQSICDGDSTTLVASGGATYQWANGPATSDYAVAPVAATTYVVTVTAAGGCFAIDSIDVDVLPVSSLVEMGESCNPADTGTVVQVLQNQFGCDSIVTRIISLLPSDTTMLSQTTCDPASAGTVTVTETNQFGCDSIVITETLFDPSFIDTTMLMQTTCDPMGAGTVTVTETNQFGCDSIVITETVYDPSLLDTTMVMQTTCDPASAGTVTFVATNQFGCDSLVIVETVFDPSFIDTTAQVVLTCDSSAIGTITDVFSNVDGCDSVVLTFVVFDPLLLDTTNLTATTCDPALVGTETATFVDSDGCDSLVITTTTLLPTDTTLLSSTTCDSSSIGVFTDVFATATCDSVVITTVTFDPALLDTTLLSATTCDPSQVGITEQVFSGNDGCDSLVITTTALLPTDTTQLNEVTCQINEVGVFTEVFATATCDSVVITTVTFDPSLLDTTIVQLTTCDPAAVDTSAALLTGTDGCDSLVITHTIFDPGNCALLANLTLQGPTCIGDLDGSATFTVVAGVSPFSYEWFDAAGNTGTGQVTGLNEPVTLTGLAAGTFTLVITGNGGFQTLTLIEDIFPPQPIVVTASVTTGTPPYGLLCAGDTNAQATVTASGGLSPYQYLWSIDSTGAQVSGLAAGDYSVTATDQNGCTGESAVSVEEPLPLTAALDVALADCGDTLIDLSILPGGGQEPYTVFIDGNITVGPMPSLAPGGYQVRIIDDNQCTLDTNVVVAGPPQPFIELPQDTFVPFGQTLRIEALTNLLDWAALEWNPLPDSLNPNSLVQRWEPEATGFYTVTITDSSGCTASDTILVRVERNVNVYVPNVFSPDNDGWNDEWTIGTGPEISELSEVAVFDRWGNMVHYWDEPVRPEEWPGWDGRMGDGDPVEVGVYVYVIRLKTIDGEEVIVEGDVTVAAR